MFIFFVKLALLVELCEVSDTLLIEPDLQISGLFFWFFLNINIRSKKYTLFGDSAADYLCLTES